MSNCLFVQLHLEEDKTEDVQYEKLRENLRNLQSDLDLNKKENRELGRQVDI